MAQLRAVILQEEVQDLISQGRLMPCLEYLKEKIVPGDKKNQIVRQMGLLQDAESKLKMLQITPDQHSKVWSNISDLVLGINLLDKDIIPDPESATNEFEIWIYCYDKEKQQSFWKEEFEKNGAKENILFKDFREQEAIPSSDKAFIILFDLTGIDDHKSPKQFCQLSDAMQEFLWFMLELYTDAAKHEKLLYNQSQSFICNNLCPHMRPLKRTLIKEVIKTCLANIAVRQKNERENESN